MLKNDIAYSVATELWLWHWCYIELLCTRITVASLKSITCITNRGRVTRLSLAFNVYVYLKLYYIYIVWVEQTPDLDTSGNTCRFSKPDLRYPTRLIVKVLISRITVHCILTVPFSVWALSWYQSCENCCQSPISYNLPYSLKQVEYVEDFIQPASSKPGPGPNLSLRNWYPTRCRFSLFVPPLLYSDSDYNMIR